MPRVPRSQTGDAGSLPWRTRLGVFVLLISLTVQSLLTFGCGPDGFGLAAQDEAQVVAADLLHSAALEEYCTQCGGPRTATGCCAHGIPMAATVVDLPQPFLAVETFALDALAFPQRNLSTLFRPPIST
jgi:hypothetical protein